MFKSNKLVLNLTKTSAAFAIVALATVSITASAGKYSPKKPMNLGRDATTDEVKAWDIDVRPDFKGLPKGSGSAMAGQEIWDAKCASCHGDFGESNEVFTPIIGGTSAEDVKTGHVADLIGDAQPQRTTMMKVSTISTLWDYIYRAMPWNAPRTLTADETFALVAYILNMSEIVEDDYVLSNENIAKAQKLMPNRNGMTQKHGMWKLKGKPDVKNKPCMKGCPTKAEITSFLPDYAKNAHGDLSQQNRYIGPIRGLPLDGVKGKIKMAKEIVTPSSLLSKNNCMACHQPKTKLVGPSFADIAGKYSDADISKLKTKVKAGGGGVWGAIPMPPTAGVSDEAIEQMVKYILDTK